MRSIIIFLMAGFLFSCMGYESEKEVLKKIKKADFGAPINLSKTEKHGDLLLTIPILKKAEYKVIFIFGGLHYATKEFMLLNTPTSFFKKNIIVTAPCSLTGGKGFRTYRKQLENILQKKGIKVSYFMVCGFSGGGPDAVDAEGPKIKLVGLIDVVPEIPKNNRNFPVLLNSMNVKNWNGNPLYNSEHFNKFKWWIRKKGGIIEENNVGHKIFPRYFFYRYRKHFI